MGQLNLRSQGILFQRVGVATGKTYPLDPARGPLVAPFDVYEETRIAVEIHSREIHGQYGDTPES